jgi:5-methylcytosine-specific restriction endonuclease McrA
MKRRNWTAAHQKVQDELYCRVCDRQADDPAHIVPRSRGGSDEADNILPLCREHHTQFDGHRIDMLEHLTREEQAEAVRLLGLEDARQRLVPSDYPIKRVAA